jgi:hypothetical protein
MSFSISLGTCAQLTAESICFGTFPCQLLHADPGSASLCCLGVPPTSRPPRRTTLNLAVVDGRDREPVTSTAEPTVSSSSGLHSPPACNSSSPLPLAASQAGTRLAASASPPVTYYCPAPVPSATSPRMIWAINEARNAPSSK